MTILSNENVNIKLSKIIFNELTKGRIINEFIYDNKLNTLIENPLFVEIRNNLSQYNMQYKMSGMKLFENSKFFYLIDENTKIDNKQPVKTKVTASIIVLVRHILSDNGKVFDYLKNINYGVSEADMSGVNDNSNYFHILKTAKIEKAEFILKYLFEKNILLKTNKDRYILSDSGQSLVYDIMKNN